ncbi:Stk1 family PASTA domain-containing Ser/Thr kinase [Nocardioides lentus]|uniref:non-specific serine/threonine protein kinase n=1 Tax=Nocardioides lentus TaxID=338077 RepID=A0ABP5AFS1_9ACTN
MGDGGTRTRGPVDASALEGRLVDGRYLVGPRIARGGMAVVHRATDVRLDRTVAIKVMHASLGDDPEFVARFVREARSAARLSHPHVVAVHDQGQADGLVYLVMEHLPGRTLRDVVRDEAPLPPRRALALLEPVLSALSAAHRAGIVHRDVKPENVLIGDDGAVKVADFGLAKAVSTETQHTATSGVLIGTVSYLAPELLTEGTSDTHADVYAAGIVLHELLTGVKPHRGDTPIQVAWHHVHTDVPAPSALAPGLPPYVDALVARACVRDVGQRPADAGVLLRHAHRVSQALADGDVDDPELVADLRPAASPGPVGAVPTSAGPVTAESDSGTWLFGGPAGAAGAGGADGPGEPWPPDDAEVDEPPVALPRPQAHTQVWDRRVPPGPTSDGPAGPSAPRRRGRGPWVVLAAVLALVLLAGGAYWFLDARWTPVPAVLGESQDAAVSTLADAGLRADVRQDYSEEVPPGEVMGVDPAAGGRVLGDGPVALTVSRGPERYDVPRVRGGSEDRAQDAVLAANLEVGERVERYDDDVEAGTVLGTTPRAGTSLPPGEEVSIIVSLGPQPVDVDDLVGTDAEDAEDRYTDAGLEVDVTEEYSDDVDAGDVVSQSPGPGELLPGETLSLVVSLGPETVVIPDGIVGSGVDEARELLEDLGLEVVEDDDDSVGLGFVVGVDPGEGERVDRGDEVTITVF